MLLRSLPRATPRTSVLPSSTPSTILRSTRSYATQPGFSPISSISCLRAKSASLQLVGQCQQVRSAHAISNPTLAGIEKRWEAMPPQEQAELWMALRDRMKVDWHEMTLQEKKAAWWIAFGPHGPRALAPPGESRKVFLYTLIGVAVSAIVFFTVHHSAREPPKTMTKEWQEATNEYLKALKSEPISGISSEGYVGPGHVQSPTAKSRGIDLEAEEE